MIRWEPVADARPIPEYRSAAAVPAERKSNDYLVAISPSENTTTFQAAQGFTAVGQCAQLVGIIVVDDANARRTSGIGTDRGKIIFSRGQRPVQTRGFPEFLLDDRIAVLQEWLLPERILPIAIRVIARFWPLPFPPGRREC